MTQFMNATELHMDITISHIDGLELKRGLTRFFLKKESVPILLFSLQKKFTRGLWQQESSTERLRKP